LKESHAMYNQKSEHLLICQNIKVGVGLLLYRAFFLLDDISSTNPTIKTR
jgi:hypothetical protein